MSNVNPKKKKRGCNRFKLRTFTWESKVAILFKSALILAYKEPGYACAHVVAWGVRTERGELQEKLTAYCRLIIRHKLDPVLNKLNNKCHTDNHCIEVSINYVTPITRSCFLPPVFPILVSVSVHWEFNYIKRSSENFL